MEYPRALMHPFPHLNAREIGYLVSSAVLRSGVENISSALSTYCGPHAACCRIPIPLSHSASPQVISLSGWAVISLFPTQHYRLELGWMKNKMRFYEDASVSP